MFISTAYLVPDVSLQDKRKHRVLRDTISTVLVELARHREPYITINSRWTVESPETRSDGTRPSRVGRSRTRRIMSGKGKFTKKAQAKGKFQAKGGSIASHTIKKSVNDYNYYLGSAKQVRANQHIGMEAKNASEHCNNRRRSHCRESTI